MTARWPRVALILALALAPIAIGAQSKQDLQTQQDIRMLQEQIQQLRLAVAARSPSRPRRRTPSSMGRWS